MGLVFHTKSDSPYDIEIANVGTMAGGARGGIPVERAAEKLVELQDDKGKSLTGKRLEEAANEFASARGFAVKSLKNVDEEKLRVEAGAFPRGTTIEEFSRRAAERDQAQVVAHRESDEAAPLVPEDLPPQETSHLPEPPGTGQEAK